MARLKYTAPALEDLDRLLSFLEEVSPGSVEGSLDAVLWAIDLLAAHPMIGRRAGADLRELVISRGSTGYLALYEVDAARDVVNILRLRHQREAGYLD